jgi:signal transduction histidine kinase
MGTNLTILQKGLFLLAVPILFQLVFFAVLLKMEWDEQERGQLAFHTKEVIAQVETTYRYLVEANSYVRRLVIAGEDPALTPPFKDAMRKSPEEFQKLKVLVQDNPPQTARVDTAAAEAERLRKWLTKVNDLVTADRLEEAKARVKDPLEQTLLDSVRKSFDELLKEEERLDDDRIRALNASWREQNWVIGVGMALSVALALAMAALFGRDIVGRLGQLAENVRRLGDKKELTQPLTGHDEIARLDAVFRAMARALREREQENEMFIYSVSHDLRSPLVNLQGFSEELSLSCQDVRAALAGGEQAGARRALEIVDKDVTDSLHFIKTAVSRLAAIIDALLRLSRVGRVEYRIQPVNVAEIVRRVTEALENTIEGRKAVVVAGALPPALGDPTAVEQVFANLIANAVHYLDPTRPGRVEIGAMPSGQEGPPGLQTYFVKDNGLGIPEAYQQRVFLAFQRLHADVVQGEGVGLALVYRMVGRLGGKIWLESTAGVGSTFYVALPPAPPDGQSAAEAKTGPVAVPEEERRTS